LKHKPILRKYNLSNDLCKWEGIGIDYFDFEKVKKISFIILRRKFLPPFCDKYQDIEFIFEHNLVNIPFEAYNENENTILKGKNRYYKAINNETLYEFLFKENFELEKKIEMIINSCHNFDSNIHTYYKDLYNYLYQSLSPDYFTLHYFKNDLDIYLNEMNLIGLQFLFIVCKKIQDHKEDFEFNYVGENEFVKIKIFENRLDELETYISLIKNQFIEIYNYLVLTDNNYKKNPCKNPDVLIRDKLEKITFKAILEKMNSLMDDQSMEIGNIYTLIDKIIIKVK